MMKLICFQAFIRHDILYEKRQICGHFNSRWNESNSRIFLTHSVILCTKANFKQDTWRNSKNSRNLKPDVFEILLNKNHKLRHTIEKAQVSQLNHIWLINKKMDFSTTYSYSLQVCRRYPQSLWTNYGFKSRNYL